MDFHTGNCFHRVVLAVFSELSLTEISNSCHKMSCACVCAGHNSYTMCLWPVHWQTWTCVTQWSTAVSTSAWAPRVPTTASAQRVSCCRRTARAAAVSPPPHPPMTNTTWLISLVESGSLGSRGTTKGCRRWWMRRQGPTEAGSQASSSHLANLRS